MKSMAGYQGRQVVSFCFMIVKSCLLIGFTFMVIIVVNVI